MSSSSQVRFGGYSSSQFIPRYELTPALPIDRLRPRKRVQPPVLQQGPVSKRARSKIDRTFQYEPLDPTKREIRLLELSPGKPGSKVIGHLFTVSLDENPSFEAMSYMWGPPQPSYNISINGHKVFPVGRNLRKALDDLRQPDKPRVLWTDAICINQRDNAEKAHQIRLMRSIYSSARVVCTWLDHSVQPDDMAFYDLGRLGKDCQLDDYDLSYWSPVADIFRNPYWRRLWIQQELILAKEIHVYCRRDVLDGQQLLQFQHAATDHSLFSVAGRMRELSKYIDKKWWPGQVLGSRILQAKTDRLAGQHHHNGSNNAAAHFQVTRRNLASSLLQLFLDTSSLDMTNPHDRVYGILGLTLDIDESKVRVDYAAPVMEIYLDVFSLFIDKHKSIDFICSPDRLPQHADTRPDGSPTWMPHRSVDWSVVHASRACGSNTAKNASIDVKTRVLSVEGVLVDTIKFVGTRYDFNKLPIRDWFPILEGYCHRLWPDDTTHERPYEREEVTTLLRYWVSQKRYHDHSQQKLERPTHDIMVTLLRAIRAIAEQTGQEKLTLRNLTFQPRHTFRNEYQVMCNPLLNVLQSNVFVETEARQLGTMSVDIQSIEPGDQVWVLYGCRMPVVLRPVAGKKARFMVVGQPIFPGIMRGEALSNGEADLRSTIIQLE